MNQLEAISQKLEVINLQLSKKKEASRKMLHSTIIALCIVVILILALLLIINSSYLNWDYKNPELAAADVLIHGFEWIFIRMLLIALIALIVGIILTRRKDCK